MIMQDLANLSLRAGLKNVTTDQLLVLLTMFAMLTPVNHRCSIQLQSWSEVRHWTTYTSTCCSTTWFRSWNPHYRAHPGGDWTWWPGLLLCCITLADAGWKTQASTWEVSSRSHAQRQARQVLEEACHNGSDSPKVPQPSWWHPREVLYIYEQKHSQCAWQMNMMYVLLNPSQSWLELCVREGFCDTHVDALSSLQSAISCGFNSPYMN